MKNPPPWGLPISILTTTTVMHMLRGVPKEVTLNDVKKVPGNFVVAGIMQGSIFCLGHLFIKMAYPVFNDEETRLPFGEVRTPPRH